MRKKFILFIIIFFVFGFVNVKLSQAITQNQINSEVQIVCPDNYGNWFSGSGTIIDAKGIILTNKHVVTDEKGGIIKACFVGFVESINSEPNFGTESNPNIAEVKYFTTADDMDAAILYLDNITNAVYPYVDIWNSNSSSLKFGDKLEVIGFPGIGGSTITYSSGDFSGFGSKTDGTQNYIKTTAPLEHGNSGGASYNPTAKFIGIPTMVVAGTLNSLSYVLSVDSIKNWLNSVLGSKYQEDIIEHIPQIAKPTISIQSDITPPQLKGFNINYTIINDNNLKKSYIRYSIPKNTIIEDGSIEKIYYYFGENKLADPLEVGKEFSPVSSQQVIEIPENFLISSSELYFIIRIKDNSGNISSSIIAPWDMATILKIGAEEFLYNQALINFTETNQSIFQKFSGLFVKNNDAIWWVSPKDKVRFILYDPTLDTSFAIQRLNTWLNSSWNGYYMSTGITTSDLAKKPKHVWGHLLSERKDDGTGSADGLYYIHPRTGKLYLLNTYISWPYVDVTTSDGLELLKFINSIAEDISTTDLNRIEPLGSNNYVWQELQYNRNNNLLPLYGFVVPDVRGKSGDSSSQESNNPSNRLKGKILLQVESHGEAWYINPKDAKKYYMADGNKAYNLMRNFGIGITNKNLDKIKSNKVFAKSNSGKIFLQVESKGEAYYIDFNGIAHYLKDGTAAYEVMRSLGLGITNSDLNKISEGSL
jgi:hypothetical protein